MQDLIPGSSMHGAYATTVREALSTSSLDKLWDQREPLGNAAGLELVQSEPSCHPVVTKLFRTKPELAALLRQELLL